jgi:hypothetical protein
VRLHHYGAVGSLVGHRHRAVVGVHDHGRLHHHRTGHGVAGSAVAVYHTHADGARVAVMGEGRARAGVEVLGRRGGRGQGAVSSYGG